ncbi:MAG: hypothetical protein IPK82_29670 [Polyangiaceae bacterium]|nr:hypothetical protein [Polyangiaceae bacterium]
MILVRRPPEPDELRKVRVSKLPGLARIAKTRPIESKEITGYRNPIVAASLWRGHERKCCYCEAQVAQGYNDVEHYRPKAATDRRPGSNDTHGYWWLAFTWKNLLFACPECNRSKKRDRFPLAVGSLALQPQKQPPGSEQPLLIDPAEESAVPHIEFVFNTFQLKLGPTQSMPTGWEKRKHWWPRARNGSLRGDWTIRVCGLDRSELCELYDCHVNQNVRSIANSITEWLKNGDDVQLAREHERALGLLGPQRPYVGLSYDALCALVDTQELVRRGFEWPTPAQVGLPIHKTPSRAAKTRRLAR